MKKTMIDKWLLLIVFALTTIGCAEINNKGLVAFNNGDYLTALKVFKPAAEQGNVLAQTY